MEFRIHIDNVTKVEENGRWVRVILKNGVVFEDEESRFSFNEPWIYHFDRK